MRRTQPAIVKGEGAHGKYEKECRSLCEKNQQLAKKQGPCSQNHKDLNLANNLNELGGSHPQSL
jgi:hypothetical protein